MGVAAMLKSSIRGRFPLGDGESSSSSSSGVFGPAVSPGLTISMRAIGDIAMRAAIGRRCSAILRSRGVDEIWPVAHML